MTEIEMTLRITRAEKDSRFRATLRLEGRIEGEWAALLERECTDLLRASAAAGLDLTEVGFIDLLGVAVLQRLSRAGVQILCRPGPVASVLEGAGVRIHLNQNGLDNPAETSLPPTSRRRSQP